MVFDTIITPKLSDTIVNHFEELILHGILKPGEKLPSERNLSRDFEVSRTALRDALTKLEARKLVRTRAGGGTVVCDIWGTRLTNPLVEVLKVRPDAIYEMLELRQTLEEIAAFTAATRATDIDRAMLIKNFDKIRPENLDANFEVNAVNLSNYHICLANAAHNVALSQVETGLFQVMKESLVQCLKIISEDDNRYQELHLLREKMHLAVLDGDSATARKAAGGLFKNMTEFLRESDFGYRSEDSAAKNSPFQPVHGHQIVSNKLSDAVVSQIEQLIHSGSLKPGDKLPPESELCESLTVSRAVLRDALVKLEARNVLVLKRGGGTFVSNQPLSVDTDPLEELLQAHPQLVFDFLELRYSLEGLAAYLSAERGSKEDVDRIKTKYDELEKVQVTPTPDYNAKLDTEFHLSLAEASQNIALVYVTRGLFDLLKASIKNNLQRLSKKTRNLDVVHDHHGDILEAIINRDPEAARNAASAHISFVNDSLRELDLELLRENNARLRYSGELSEAELLE